MAAKNIKIFIICILISIVLVPDRIVVFNRLKVDFASFLFAGKALSQGLNIYDYKILQQFAPDQKFHVYPYLYTPVLAILIKPLISLTNIDAQNIWSIINLLFYAISIFILYKFTEIYNVVPKELNSGRMAFLRKQELPIHISFGHSKLRRNDLKVNFWKAYKEYFINNNTWFEPIIVIFLLELILPYRYIFYLGQVDLLIMSFIILSLYFLKIKKGYSAGLSLSIAALLKISPAILVIYFIAKKNYKAVAGFALGSVIIFIVSSLFGGWNSWLVFFNSHLFNFANSQNILGLTNISGIYNFSVIGTLSRLFPQNFQIDKIISYIIILSLLIISFLKTRKCPGNHSGLLLFNLLCVISMPFSWRQHLIYLMPGLFLYYLDFKDYSIKAKLNGLIPIFLVVTLMSYYWVMLSERLSLNRIISVIFINLNVISIVILIFLILYNKKFVEKNFEIQEKT